MKYSIRTHNLLTTDNPMKVSNQAAGSVEPLLPTAKGYKHKNMPKMQVLM